MTGSVSFHVSLALSHPTCFADNLGGEKQLPPFLAARRTVVSENVLRTAILVEEAGAAGAGGLILARTDQDVGLAASRGTATELHSHRFPDGTVTKSGSDDGVRNFVNKRVEDIGFGVLVGVVIAQGDKPSPGAAEADHVTEGTTLEPPAPHIQTVLLE